LLNWSAGTFCVLALCAIARDILVIDKCIKQLIFMKRNSLLKFSLAAVSSLTAILFACSAEDVDPVADFTFRDETTSTFVMATYDTCSLVNRSRNGQSVSWNLGDGRSSNDRNVVLFYEKSGTYDVTLTITGKDGQETTVSKTVTVKDRVLRSIEISKVYWEENINGWPATSKADIYLQIQKYTDAAMTEGFLCANCPVLYTSPVVQEVEHSTISPITIPVTEKIIIDKRMIKFADPENLDNAYLISLMAKDENGNEYCLQSNRGGGTYFGVLTENFAGNEFIVQNGPFSDYRLVCDFE
jgi:PKD repeat protein